MAPIVSGRRTRATRARYSRTAGAAACLADAGFGHDVDVVLLTDGQFSFIDLVSALLDVTGPADVAISTWSAGFYDVEAARAFRDNGHLRSVRFILDSSAKRGQAPVARVADIFGEDAVRATRNHAKFATIENDEWHVLIATSANLNLNERNEWFSIADEPERCALFRSFVDDLWRDLPPGDTGDRRTPRAPGTDAAFGVRPQTGIRSSGTIASSGRMNRPTPD